MPPRLKALLAMSPEHPPLLFPAHVLDRLTGLVDIDPGAVFASFDAPGAAEALGKGVFASRERYAGDREFVVAEIETTVGNYGRTVGIVGASRIGRRVIELLRLHDFDLCVYDPHASVEGIRQVGLPELLATCDIVSLHAPLTGQTRRMIGAAELAAMRDDAILINTARGELVDHDALGRGLKSGRLSAVLDVTEPETLPADSVLFDLPNVFLTPHIAGSQGNELARLGTSAVDEAERLATGRPLAFGVDLDALGRTA